MGKAAGLTVRSATASDTERIAELSSQLGYACTTGETAHRLLEIIGRSEHAIFVADIAGRVIGWVHVLASHSLLADTPAEIVGLVVDERHRGRAVGQALMDRAEHWAREMKCGSVRLRSNVVRSRAHAFYEKLGYREIKTQKAFSKDLTAVGD